VYYQDGERAISYNTINTHNNFPPERFLLAYVLYEKIFTAFNKNQIIKETD